MSSVDVNVVPSRREDLAKSPRGGTVPHGAMVDKAPEK